MISCRIAFEKRVSKPTMIIARTVPGKGVAEFENKPEWHGKTPSEEQAGKALRRLEHMRKILEGSR